MRGQPRRTGSRSPRHPPGHQHDARELPRLGPAQRGSSTDRGLSMRPGSQRRAQKPDRRFQMRFSRRTPSLSVFVAEPATVARSSPGSSPPAATAQTPEAQAMAKANAYTEAQNHLVRSHPLEQQLADYRRDNERVLKLGTKLGANAWYHFGIVDFDGVVDELEKAVALPGVVPEVDAQAAPAAGGPTRGQSHPEGADALSDHAGIQGGWLQVRPRAARDPRPPRRGGRQGDGRVWHGLFEREIARDERRLAALPEDAPARRLLSTSLTLRRAVRRFEALGPKADVAPFLAALGEVSNANRHLGTVLDGMSPKANSSCTGYTDTVASVIGHGRDVARDIRAKGDPGQPAQRFNETYNRSVRDLETCQKNESRVRRAEIGCG